MEYSLYVLAESWVCCRNLQCRLAIDYFQLFVDVDNPALQQNFYLHLSSSKIEEYFSFPYFPRTVHSSIVFLVYPMLLGTYLKICIILSYILIIICFLGHKCSCCSRVYTRKDTLQRHMKTRCGAFKQFQCQLCPYRSGFLHHFKGHLSNKHNLLVDSKTIHDFVTRLEEEKREAINLQDFNFIYTQL